LNPIARTSIVGIIESREGKKVNDKNLAEVRVEGFGLKINFWGDLAAKVPAPGSTVVIEGKTVTRSYQVECKDRHSTEITASTIEVISANSSGAASAAPAEDDDDLPF